VVAGAAGADRRRKRLEDHVTGAVESAYPFGGSEINVVNPA
jgi:hypothetical protein